MHGTLQIDESFDRDYTVEWLVDLPNSVEPRYFPNRTEHSDGSGPILRVTTNPRNSFLVIFDFCHEELRLSTWPNPKCLFVQPSNVLIDIRRPDAAATISPKAARFRVELTRFPGYGLMIVDCLGYIQCYDTAGMRWDTETYNKLCHEDGFNFEIRGEDLVIHAHADMTHASKRGVEASFNLQTGEAH